MVIINKKFDKEYRTQWTDEVIHLKEHGIRYVFAKEIDGITTYKYKKTAKLFNVLADFYQAIEDDI